MMVLDYARTLIVFGAMVLVWHDLSSAWLFFAISFLMSFLGGSYVVARRKSIPEIVGKDNLVKANSLDGIAAALVRIGAWGLGGFFVSAYGFTATLLINAAASLLSCILLSLSTWQSEKEEEQETKSALMEAWKTIKGHGLIKSLILTEISYYLFMGFFWAAFPLRIAQIGDGFVYGMHGAVFGVGYLLTSTLLTAKKGKSKSIAIYFVGILLYAVGNVVSTFTLSPTIVLIGVFLGGLGVTYWGVGRTTLIHTDIETAKVGKVFSFYESATSFVQIPAYLLGGLLSDHLSPGVLMGAIAILQFIPILSFALSSKKFRFKQGFQTTKV
jgi:DHA3 family macrolide efflux protein-like MFS transporter